MDTSLKLQTLKAPVTETLRMTQGQQAIWLDQKAHARRPLYNIGGSGFLDGDLDLNLFRKTLDMMVEENDALRLALKPDGSLILLDQVIANMEVLDFRNEADPLAKMEALWDQEFKRPFKFDGRTPLWWVKVARLSETRYGLFPVYHHLAMDGYGSSIVIQRWSSLYNQLVHTETVLPQIVPSYRDFLLESEQYRVGEAFEKDRQFWAERLLHLPPVLIAPRHQLNEDGELGDAEVCRHRVSRPLYDQLEEQNGSAVWTFIAVLALYYARVSGQSEVVIGVPTLNRGGKRYKSTLGMFMNVMPLQVDIDPKQTLAELVGSIGKNLRACYRHQRFPLTETSRRLGVIQQGRNAVFDVMFSFERQDYDVSFGRAKLSGNHQMFSGVARFPIAITVCEFALDQDVEIILEADCNYLFKGEAPLLLKRWHLLLETIACAPETLCAEALLIPDEERTALIQVSSQSLLVPHMHETVIHAFMDQLSKNPKATAIISGTKTLSYAELDIWSNRIANQITACGAGPDTIVAFCIERSPAMIATIFAILRIGAAFMPLDPDAPIDRLRSILADADVGVAIVDAAASEHLKDMPCELIRIDDLSKNEECEKGSVTFSSANARAYVLYTSGSSGQPKGVVVEHGALMSRVAWATGAIAWARSCQGTQITFDPAMIEVFTPLCNGGVIILPPAGRQSMQVIARTILDHKATFAIFVPSTLPGFLDAIEGQKGLALEIVWCGGEILQPALARRFLEITGAKLINCYGPTEATILATTWECGQDEGEGALPVGRAIAQTSILILDGCGLPVPFGVSGEIHIGGAGLARGYLNRPDQDQERFRTDPFHPEMRIYRTGDRGTLSVEGILSFSGRLDRQVKVRGHRIEPDEIETVLLDHPFITTAAVKADDHQGVTSLFAWVAPESISIEDVRNYLHSKFPDYMVPNFIHVMAALPQSRSGKVNWDALPKIAYTGSTQRYVAPRTVFEEELVGLWEDILDRSSVGVYDNFFALGGDSLSAMTFLAGLDTLLGEDSTLSLSFFIHHPTIAELAEALTKSLGHHPIVVSLSHHPSAPTLFLAASSHGDAVRFHGLADSLGDQCSVVMLQPPLINQANMNESQLVRIARLYGDAIEMRADGDFIVGGFSIGGILALETARELTKRNRAPRRTILLETLYPHPMVNSVKIWMAFVRISKLLALLGMNVNGRKLGTMLADQGLITQIEAAKDYKVTPFAGPVDLVVSNGLNWLRPLLFSPWNRALKNHLRILRVGGWHGSMFMADHVKGLSKAISESLRTD